MILDFEFFLDKPQMSTALPPLVSAADERGWDILLITAVWYVIIRVHLRSSVANKMGYCEVTAWLKN
ncbi:MAG: hypothetical protein EOM20_05730 [Spartobacteria bacterium]|nr:hypothetical protein [Spartobacteria bacterium]